MYKYLLQYTYDWFYILERSRVLNYNLNILISLPLFPPTSISLSLPNLFLSSMCITSLFLKYCGTKPQGKHLEYLDTKDFLIPCNTLDAPTRLFDIPPVCMYVYKYVYCVWMALLIYYICFAPIIHRYPFVINCENGQEGLGFKGIIMYIHYTSYLLVLSL